MRNITYDLCYLKFNCNDENDKRAPDTNFKKLGANYLQSVFWTYNFEKKFWISTKIISLKIPDFYEFFVKILSFYKKKFVEVQCFDKYILRSPVFWDLEFS